MSETKNKVIEFIKENGPVLASEIYFKFKPKGGNIARILRELRSSDKVKSEIYLLDTRQTYYWLVDEEIMEENR